jgi:pyruvate dehydrogenase E2 component (dihydrolipoamide acetyltransferase)
MAEYIRMPQKGLTEESAILSKWFVKKGDQVKEGQLLFALETGKAVFDVEAEVTGTVLDIRGNEGDEIAVKAVVCVIGTPGESVNLPENAPGPQDNTPAVPSGGEISGTEDPKAVSKAAAPAGTEDEKVRISPRARRLAEKHRIPAAGLAGTGPGGRIIEDDVRAAIKTPRGSAPAAIPAAGFTSVPNDRMRKAIAAAMMRSLQGMAQYTMTASFDAAEMLDYRERHNAAHPDSGKLSINDLVIFTLSRVLLDFPYMNAHCLEEETRLFSHAHIGVAVHTPKGLLVPTVKNADRKSLSVISAEVKDLALRCRSGSILPDDLRDGTFTLTNIGVYGIEYFTPIINPPQTGILGVGKIEYKRKKTARGMTDYPAIGLSLTCDHRAVDGAPAAKFMQALVAELENFSLLLVK